MTDQEIGNHPDYAQWEAKYGPDYARLRAQHEARKTEEQAAQQRREEDRAALWSSVSLPEIPFLQSLYDAVLVQSEKRMPKWKFRLAADLMLEIQPKLTRLGRLFHWSALKCDGADEKLLALPHNQLDRPYVALSGTLIDGQRDSDGASAGYDLKARHVSWSRGGDLAAGLALRERIAAAFREGRFDQFTPSMLGSHCLICGKALTDPVSQARFIGPECFGTASLRIPWLRDASGLRAS